MLCELERVDQIPSLKVNKFWLIYHADDYRHGYGVT